MIQSMLGPNVVAALSGGIVALLVTLVILWYQNQCWDHDLDDGESMNRYTVEPPDYNSLFNNVYDVKEMKKYHCENEGCNHTETKMQMVGRSHDPSDFIK